tara:strand:+ start:977 stop:1300 length:324 start_codon:yes stop_codon:yes gene_type:complete
VGAFREMQSKEKADLSPLLSERGSRDLCIQLKGNEMSNENKKPKIRKIIPLHGATKVHMKKKPKSKEIIFEADDGLMENVADDDNDLVIIFEPDEILTIEKDDQTIH